MLSPIVDTISFKRIICPAVKLYDFKFKKSKELSGDMTKRGKCPRIPPWTPSNKDLLSTLLHVGGEHWKASWDVSPLLLPLYPVRCQAMNVPCWQAGVRCKERSFTANRPGLAKFWREWCDGSSLIRRLLWFGRKVPWYGRGIVVLDTGNVKGKKESWICIAPHCEKLASEALRYGSHGWYTANFGSRAFRISTLKNWNILTLKVRQSHSLSTFENHLKTFCFRSAYPFS